MQKAEEVMKENNMPSPQMQSNDFSMITERARESFESQVISPLRGSELPTSTSPALSMDSNFKDVSRTSFSATNNNNLSTDSLFSPLKEQSVNSPLNMSGSSILLPKTPIGSFNKSISTPLVSPLTMITEEDLHFHPEEMEAPDLPPKMPKLSNNSIKNTVGGDHKALPKPDQIDARKTDQIEVEDLEEISKMIQKDPSSAGAISGTMLETFKESQVRANSTPFHNSEQKEQQPGSKIKCIMNAFPEVLMDTTGSHDDNVDPHVTAIENEVKRKNENLTVFQLENLRSCVEDAMDDFCTDMRQLMWHMQYDNIRQFQNQKHEFDLLLRHYSANEQLREENAKVEARERRTEEVFLKL